VQYGVKAHLIDFCSLPQIGRVRAQKLWDAGFRTLGDVSGNLERVQAITRLKRATCDEICDQAKILMLTQGN